MNDSANDSAIEEIIQDLPFKWTVQGTIFLVASLAYMFDAYGVLLPTYLIPMLNKSSWQLAYGQLGWLGSVILIGMAIGAIVWSSLADVIGRRRVLLATIAEYSVFIIISAAASSYGMLLFCFFVAGVGLGGCIPVAYAIVAEFMPFRSRGKFLTAVNLFWPIGATLNGFVALHLVHYGNWRLIPICMGAPAILVLLAAYFVIPESPLFLIQKGKSGCAYEVINNFVRRAGNGARPSVKASVTTPVVKSVPVMPRLGIFATHFVDLWNWNWRTTSAVWLAVISILLLYFGVITWLPGILVKSGYGLYRADLFSTSVTAIGILANLLAIWIAEAFGRKLIIVIGALTAGAAMVLFTMYIQVPAYAHCWLLLFGFMNSMVIPVMYGYLPEVYPTSLRAIGFGWTNAAARTVAGLIPVLFGVWLWPTFGLTGTYSMVLGIIAIAMLWFVLVAPETRGSKLSL